MKILIVDDEEALREIYKELLNQEGFEIEEAENGEVALSKLKKKKYDFVMLDIIMPKIDGLMVLEKLGKDKVKDKKIVIFSALYNKNIVTKARELGAYGYEIISEITPEQAISRIKGYLNGEILSEKSFERAYAINRKERKVAYRFLVEFLEFCVNFYKKYYSEFRLLKWITAFVFLGTVLGGFIASFRVGFVDEMFDGSASFYEECIKWDYSCLDDCSFEKEDNNCDCCLQTGYKSRPVGDRLRDLMKLYAVYGGSVGFGIGIVLSEWTKRKKS